MAVLGCGGRLELKRCAPSACLISADSLDAEANVYDEICDGYWSGDHVVVDCLPILEDGLPRNPEGWAQYQGSKWFVGPNRWHISSNTDNFYKTADEYYPDGQFGDAAQFYGEDGDQIDGNEVNGCPDGGEGYWIHIDELGRVSFYNSRCAALAGCPDNRVNLYPIGEDITVAPYGSVEYLNSVWRCRDDLGEYQFSDGQRTVLPFDSICDHPPRYEQPPAGVDEYDNADMLPRPTNTQGEAAPYWQCVLELREWTLQLDAPSVDTTSVSEKFGEAVKSLVRGGGVTEFFIDRQCLTDEQADSNTIMKLLFLTEHGCNADAEFYIIDRDGCGPDCGGSLGGALYYEAHILITRTAINLRPTELIAGTASFVTTGPIHLRESS